jgi:serine phosphatase RsbU (regulator of sigma subunit)
MISIKRDIKLLMTVFVVGCFCMASCQQGGKGTTYTVQDSIRDKHVDSLILWARHINNVDSVYAVVDSLERIKEIGPIRADFERGNINYKTGHIRNGDIYWEKALDAEVQGEKEERYYYRCATLLANKLQSRHDFEGALRISLSALEKMKKSAVGNPMDIGIQYGDIGICQLKMSRYDEAAKSFEESFKYFNQAVEIDTTALSCQNAIIISSNTTLFCIDSHLYEQALQWISRAESFLEIYKKLPKNDAEVCDRQYARICSFKARTYLGLGQRDKAEYYFAAYQNSESYKKGIEHAPGEYQLASGRYAEAVESYADIENEIHRRMAKPTLDIIQQYVFPKYRANAGAGYRDSTIAIGLRILDALDSAIVWQKNDDAAELAIIYETQEKDRQIAEQKASLSQQRLIGMAIVFVLIILALTIFIFYRHRAARRLEVAHEELKVAYDQLEETTAVKERIESELRIARDIQMSMVPHEFPVHEGLDMYARMTPAKEVGGDLYGYVIRENMLYFAVGDVSGKGIPASLFMAQATRLFRTLAHQDMMPAEICTRMNRELAGNDNTNGMFITMFIGMLDMQTGHLDFCNAGHNSPVIGGGSNHGDFLKMESNAPIGLWQGLKYVGEQIDTIKGRALFIYTDGLNEAENEKQEQFGEKRLIDSLRNTRYDTAQQVVEMMMAEVEKYRNGAEVNDDLTMMCLKVS